jgi:hypothetical protein
MALNSNILTAGLSGHIGGLIFYDRKGVSCVRQMPKYGPNSMSAASKQSSNEFGQASKAAKSIRASLNGIWAAAHDDTMVYRLNTAVYAALREDPHHERGARVFSANTLHKNLKDFRFNENATLTIKGVETNRQEDGSVKITLPVNWQQRLKQPKGFNYIQLQAIALDMDFSNNTCLHTTTTAICMPVGARENTLLLPAQPGKATATVVVLQMRFLKANYITESMNSQQAFIAAVLEPVRVPEATPIAPKHKPVLLPESNTPQNMQKAFNYIHPKKKILRTNNRHKKRPLFANVE